jgi:hypothetical protein
MRQPGSFAQWGLGALLMNRLPDIGPLFKWAEMQNHTRRPQPANICRVARRAQISTLHAKALCEAHGLPTEVLP